VEVRPPTMGFGLKVTDVGPGGDTVRVPVSATPPYVADTTTSVEAPTALVVAVNVADVWPAATVTLAGTATTPMSALDSVTTAPLAGAGSLIVTVPVEVFPPRTGEGLKVSEVGTGGVTVSVAVSVTPA
jgi:hypothetical protein